MEDNSIKVILLRSKDKVKRLIIKIAEDHTILIIVYCILIVLFDYYI